LKKPLQLLMLLLPLLLPQPLHKVGVLHHEGSSSLEVSTEDSQLEAPHSETLYDVLGYQLPSNPCFQANMPDCQLCNQCFPNCVHLHSAADSDDLLSSVVEDDE